jgi:hypothetical protein
MGNPFVIWQQAKHNATQQCPETGRPGAGLLSEGCWLMFEVGLHALFAKRLNLFCPTPQIVFFYRLGHRIFGHMKLL